MGKCKCPFCDQDNITRLDLLKEKNFSKNAFLIANLKPITSLHWLVIPRKHRARIDTISEQAWVEICLLARQAVIRISDLIKTKNIQIFWNEGKEAGQSLDHFHLHILARKDYRDGFIPIQAKEDSGQIISSRTNKEGFCINASVPFPGNNLFSIQAKEEEQMQISLFRNKEWIDYCLQIRNFVINLRREMPFSALNGFMVDDRQNEKPLTFSLLTREKDDGFVGPGVEENVIRKEITPDEIDRFRKLLKNIDTQKLFPRQ